MAGMGYDISASSSQSSSAGNRTSVGPVQFAPVNFGEESSFPSWVWPLILVGVLFFLLNKGK